MLIVQKFGGSSLAGLDRLRRAAEICLKTRRAGAQVLAVVSAAGDGTDALLGLARRIEPQPPPRELDALMATGERQSAALMAIMLHSLGAPARSFSGRQAGIHTDGRHQDAAILSVDPARLRRALDAGEIAVAAGFQGLSPEGDVSTLGRGGSDTSAVALAAALGADRCEIYTDVDGIYTADPRRVPRARLLEEIDFRDMLALAEAGAQVLHPESVRRAMEAGLDLRLLSSFREGPGTALSLLPGERRPAFAGVTGARGTGAVTLAGRGAGEEAAGELAALLSDAGIPAAALRLAPGRITLTVPPERQEEALRLVHRRYLE